jgi:hypothetical protein
MAKICEQPLSSVGLSLRLLSTNDMLDFEIEAANTQFAADSDSMSAFASLFDGDQWMIYRNVATGVLHWDFSVLGRFISFPAMDPTLPATNSILVNLTEVQRLGQEWHSQTMVDVAENLQTNTTNANAGSLKGNRMFYNNDYMVTSKYFI